MRIEVKYMVCHHCVRALGDIVDRIGLHILSIGLGYVEIEEPLLSPEQYALLDNLLADSGFERVTSREMQIVEKVKRVVLDHVRSDHQCSLNLSVCIEKEVGEEYKTISRVFSRLEGRTIERYYILQKIERVKELLSYGEMGLTEIAFVTDYSSVAHLSRQFKQVTGMTPTQYLALGAGDRKPLNRV